MLLFSTKKSWCDIISLTVLTFTDKNLKKRREERGFSEHSVLVKVYCLLLISKRVFNERLHILVLFFYLFVCTF